MAHQQTVYLIDPDSSDRRSLAFELGNLGIEAWPFPSGADFIAALGHLRPQCIILAMEVSQGGLQFMRNLRGRGVDWPLVALGHSSDLRTGIEAMKLGASEFLGRPVDFQALLLALNQGSLALEGMMHAREARRSAEERVGCLTARERDIAIALVRGRPNKIVAHQLGISVRTVEAHRANIMMKLRVRSLPELLLLIAEAGIGISPAAPASTQSASPLRAQTNGGTAPPSRMSGDSYVHRASRA